MAAVNTASLIRLSVSSTGVAGAETSYGAGVSGSGRFALFYSNDAKLVGKDSNNTYNLFLRDTATNTTTLVSNAPDGALGNDNSLAGSVSDNGRFVAFSSYATNLVAGDTNVSYDVFVRDLSSGATFRISQAVDGTEGNARSADPTISGDGRFVVFESNAGNLVADDGNAEADVFIYDMLSGTPTLVSRATDGSQGDSGSYNADVSADGRFVVFESYATNLVAGDTNSSSDVFLRDLQAGTTTRVSLGAGGAQGNGGSFNAHLSDNGRFITFQSAASNLVKGDTNEATDVFVRDTATGTTKLVSANTSGGVGNNASSDADISADGRYVVFISSATDLVSGDTNGTADVFLRDTVAGTTTRLSVAWNGAQANGASLDPHIAADGRSVVFSSFASNLVRGDTNGSADVFRVSLVASDAADRMIGSDRADSISGLGGSDIVDGGLGADTLTGGTGNDTFLVDNAGDRVVEASGGGYDTVLASVSYTLTAGQAIESLATIDAAALTALDLTGNAAANTITGNNGANTLNGGAGGDVLIGRAGADTYIVDTAADRVIEAAGGGSDRVFASSSYALAAGQEVEVLQLLSSTGSSNFNLAGNEFRQTIVGNNGANGLEGKGGFDILTGRGGADLFVFASTLGRSNVDRITDFAAEDTIRLSKAIFSVLDKGVLEASAFKNISTGTADAGDHILYKQATGELYYDADGAGRGAAAVKFAALDNKFALTAADFLIV